MLLKTFKGIVGSMGMYTNAYVIHDEKTHDGAIIDLCGQTDKMYNYIENSQITLKYIILTHCHGDHTYGLSDMKRNYPKCKVIIHEADRAGLTLDTVNLCSFVDVPCNIVEADIVVKDGDVISLGDMKIKVIHTPGHTIGSMCLLVDDALFSGDTLFKNGWGRTDLPTSDFKSILGSIEKKLLPIDDSTIVYPGHGATTIMLDEKVRYM